MDRFLDPRVSWAIRHMDATLHERMRITELARAVNLSSSRFSALFREHTGMSPAQYIQLRRLERARLLIEGTFLSVKEVMARVGFNDPSHFTRAFTRHHGTTPTGLRSLGAPPISSMHDSSCVDAVEVCK